MTIINALKSLSAYPIPAAVFDDTVAENGLNASDEATQEVRESKQFKRAKARIYEFLAEAPNISQGGVTFSYSATEKSLFRKKADELLCDANGDGVEYGWDGENF